jgi:hypothetical protein
MTPTRDTLVVALDFEGKLNQSSMRHNVLISESNQGVHSIERSAQEDTLLVLFNTAISNLVCHYLHAVNESLTMLHRCYSGITLP